MLDVKKLITGFLILAAGASSSALILSNIGNQPTIAVVAQNQDIQPATTTAPIATNNAFVPTVDDGTADATDGSSSDPTNLTNGMADAFVASLVSANPNGPQQDENGSPQLATPDSQTIADALQGEPAMQNVTMPDWDTEVANLQSQIKTASYSTTTVANYITNFNAVVDSQLVKTGLGALAQNSNAMPSNEPSVVARGENAASDMLSSALAFPTPTPLVDFQKSFIKLLVYQKDMAQLVTQKEAQDPEMVAVVMQTKDSDYQAAVQNFEAQGKSLNGLLTSYDDEQNGSNAPLSFIDSLFFIHPAHAQWFVTDPLTHLFEQLGVSETLAGQWATYLAAVAKDMVLQIGKNLIMALIQQKVLAYIQGSGAPRFITNWGTDLVNAGTMSAINAINSNYACVAPNSSALSSIQLVLNAIYKPGNNACAASFNSLLSQGITPQQFYNKFSNGGFLTFGQTLQPSNNFYGGLFFSAQAAGQASQQGTSLFTLKTNSAQGYRSSQVCSDGSNPNAFRCERANGTSYNSATATCGEGETVIPNDGQCANGSEPAVTMPGIVNKDALATTLGGSKAAVAAATSLAGLAEFAAQDLLMGLVNLGIKNATQAFNGALQGDGGIMSVSPSSISAPTVSSTVASPLTCSPSIISLTATGTPVSFVAYGGTYDKNGAAPNYNWSAADGTTGIGTTFNVIDNILDPFIVTLNDDAGDASAICTVQVTLPPATTTSTPPATPTP